MKERTKPQPRLLVLQSCGSCPYSMDREICTHPKAPGREHPLGWGDPPILFRALPKAPAKYGSCVSNAPPPDWCPLPVAPEANSCPTCKGRGYMFTLSDRMVDCPECSKSSKSQ